MATWRSTGSTWRSRFIPLGRWRKAIGRWAPTSINARTRNRPRRSARSSPAPLAGLWPDFTPLIGTNLGVKKVPITYRAQKRSAEVPSILHMAVDPLPTMHPSGEIWANIGHRISPDRPAFAVGAAGSTFSDHAMVWDNSGKNGHYAPIRWSNH